MSTPAQKTTDTDTTTAQATPAGQQAVVTLDSAIARGTGRITQLQVRKPRAGALRGINLAELLQLRAEAVMLLLPRITEPPLLKHEVEAMEPVDLIACATEVVDFLVPQATLAKAHAAQKEAAFLNE